MAAKCSRCGSRIDPGSLKCPDCGAYVVVGSDESADRMMRLSDVKPSEEDRVTTDLCDEIFGGGIVKTSANLIGGAPGAGKSTLSLQLSGIFARKGANVLYLASEEEPGQIRSRADRLGVQCMEKIFIVNLLGDDIDVTDVLEDCRVILGLVVLDSLPGLCGKNGEEALRILRGLKNYSAQHKCPSLIIDHVNKELDFAGLMALQHAVDSVIGFYPDDKTGERSLKPLKNRHGPAFVENVYDMTERGLVFLRTTVQPNLANPPSLKAIVPPSGFDDEPPTYREGFSTLEPEE